MLHLNVNSPRIVLFKSMSAFAKGVKISLLVALLCLGCWGVKRGANTMFADNEKYLLTDISLQTNGSFSKQRVVNETLIKQGATLFTLDLMQMEKVLGELPEVVEVSVRREFPDKIVVEMTERVPVAWVHAPSAGFRHLDRKNGLLVGEDGVLFPCEGHLWNVSYMMPAIVIEKAEEYAFEVGEVMRHEEAVRAMHLVKQHKEVFKDMDWKLKSVKVVDFNTLVAEYSDDVIVTFGMYDHARQLMDLRDIRAHAATLGKEIQWLDLRPKRNIPGKYKISQLTPR